MTGLSVPAERQGDVGGALPETAPVARRHSHPHAVSRDVDCVHHGLTGEREAERSDLHPNLPRVAILGHPLVQGGARDAGSDPLDIDDACPDVVDGGGDANVVSNLHPVLVRELRVSRRAYVTTASGNGPGALRSWRIGLLRRPFRRSSAMSRWALRMNTICRRHR